MAMVNVRPGIFMMWILVESGIGNGVSLCLSLLSSALFSFVF